MASENDPQSREKEDRERQRALRSRANRSIAILEKSFIKKASGRYVVLGLRGQ